MALFFGGTTLVSAQTIDTSTEAPELQGELDPELQHHQQTCISIPATSHGVSNSAPLETNIASPNDVLVEAKTLTLQREVFQYIASYVEADARSTTSLKQFIKITEGLCQRRDIAAIAISTEIDPANPGTATSVTVAVTGRDLVHDVQFIGNEYIDDDVIRDQLYRNGTLQLFQEDQTRVCQGIQSFYRKHGFPQATAQCRYAFERDKGVLYVDIQEGNPLRLQKINIKIAGSASQEKIRRRLRYQPGDFFDPTKLQQKLETIRVWLRKRNFLMSQVRADFSVSSPVRSPVRSIEQKPIAASSQEAILNVTIETGPEIEVRFHGRKYYFLDRDNLLKNIIELTEENRFSRGWFEDAVFKMTDYYHKQGFPDATISYQDSWALQEQRDEAKRDIVFKVEKKQRTKIRDITISGKTAQENDRLVRLLNGGARGDLYSRPDFEDRIERLKNVLQELGFHDAQEADFDESFSPNRELVDLTVRVFEGDQFFFGKTTLTGITADQEEDLREVLTYETDEPFILSSYQTSLLAVRNTCRKMGYPLCKVRGVIEPGEDSKKDVVLQVESGPKVRFGNVFLEGNRRTRNRVLTREVLFDVGETYSPQRLDRSKRAIQGLGFFNSVVFDPLKLDPVEGYQDYVIRVRERKPRNLRLRGGIGTDDGVRATTDFNYLNIGGTGRNVFLSAGLSHDLPGDLLEWRLVGNYLEPHLFSLPIDGRLQASFQRSQEEFGNIDRTALFAGTEYLVDLWLQTLVKWELEFREPFDLRIDAEDLNDFDQSRRLFGSIGALVTLDFRDDPFNPRWGYLSQTNAELYSKSFLSEEEFYQFQTRQTVFLPIHKDITTIISLRLGFGGTFGSTLTAGNEDIPVEKRFRLGGSQSLRGFSRDSVGGQNENEAASRGEPAAGGNSMLNYLIEVGFPLFWGFRLVTFTDGGNAFTLNENFDPLNLRHSAGVGLRYITPIGPLRLDYGFKLDRRTGESLTAVHFAVGLF